MKNGLLAIAAAAAACTAAALACSIQTIFPYGLEPAPGTASQQVGAAGGVVTTDDGTTLIIPPNALQSEVTITIGLAADAGVPPGATSVATAHVLGPPGLVFYAPVCVTLAYEPPILPVGTTESNVVIYEDVPPLTGDGGEASTEGGGDADVGAGQGLDAGALLDPCLLPCPATSGDGGLDGASESAGAGAGAEAETEPDDEDASDGGPPSTGYPVSAYFALPSFSFAADPSHVTGITRQLGTVVVAFSASAQELEIHPGDAACSEASTGAD